MKQYFERIVNLISYIIKQLIQGLYTAFEMIRMYSDAQQTRRLFCIKQFYADGSVKYVLEDQFQGLITLDWFSYRDYRSRINRVLYVYDLDKSS